MKQSPTTEDLLQDESFLNFYFQKNPTDIFEWEDWSEGNPPRQALVREAFGMLDKLSLKWNEHQIMDKILRFRGDLVNDATPSPEPRAIPLFAPYWRVAAAVAMLLLAAGGFWYLSSQKTPNYNNWVAQAQTPLLEKQNTRSTPLRLALPDGTVILLGSGSRLSYAADFKTQKREVYLEGEAFFDVAKDATRPFYVYANELVTKVLGTSFFVKASQNNPTAQVIVKTGKVSVYFLKKVDTSKPDSPAEAVVITPNQQINFDRNSSRFVKALVAEPAILAPAPTFAFDFRNAPASEVFEVLEKAYGVPMIYDEELLKDCLVTAPLSDESLFEKLDLICRAIEADYATMDGQIVVTGKGCKHPPLVNAPQ